MATPIQPTSPMPGAGVFVGNGGTPEPVTGPHLDDDTDDDLAKAVAALAAGNLLIGALPGSGKSGLLNLVAATAALDPDGTNPPVPEWKEGGPDDADPGR